MRSILEKALIALLNEEKDKADALFHDFILERSRQIHESLRQGEDFILDESLESELSIDEMFSEADLGDDEDQEQVVEFAGDEEDFGGDTEVGGDDAMGTDLDTVDGEEAEEEPESLEDRVVGLEADLQRLAAEFDAMMDGEELPVDGEEIGAEVGDDLAVAEGTIEITQHADGEVDVTSTTPDAAQAAPAMGGMGGDDLGLDYSELDGDDDMAMEADDFDDLSESAVDELEKVTTQNTDGREQGNGKFKQQTVSPTTDEPFEKRASLGKAVSIKSSTHTGYNRESEPSSKKIPARQNTVAKSTSNLSPVKKEGDKSALLNKIGADAGGQNSLIGSKKK